MYDISYGHFIPCKEKKKKTKIILTSTTEVGSSFRTEDLN